MTQKIKDHTYFIIFLLLQLLQSISPLDSSGTDLFFICPGVADCWFVDARGWFPKSASAK